MHSTNHRELQVRGAVTMDMDGQGRVGTFPFFSVPFCHWFLDFLLLCFLIYFSLFSPWQWAVKLGRFGWLP
jgi:hypothetical protein